MFSRFVEWEFQWKEKGAWLKKYKPKTSKFKAFRHFNFIILHYMYMLFWVIAGSVMIYGPRNMDYIDALFFASGATTQSGLNTINLNDITTYQQVTIILISCITNPIFINTMVVLIRLYWFEKRFQHVVQDARSWRRSRTKSRSKSEMKHESEHDNAERGVGNRKITVIRGPNGHTSNGKGKESESDSDIAVPAAFEGNPTGSDHGPLEKKAEDTPKSPTFQRDIMWADQIRPSRAEHLDIKERLPVSRTQEENIKFLEKQRQGERIKLRVPGPRDFDRGELPQQVDDDELGRTLSKQDSPEAGREKHVDLNSPNELNDDDHPVKKEEKNQRHINWTPNVSNMLPHRSRTDADDEQGNTLRRRGRTGTFQSFFSTRSEDRDPIPYLSYAPTVGRNSLFVDLTEEQREELGGVEYRSLKTLAWILCTYYLGFHAFGIVCLLPWIQTTHWKNFVIDDGQSVSWWGIFTPMSMFTDLGFTLTPDSMISFQYAIFPLLLGSFLIVIGNTGFPCMLRFVIWITHKVVRYGTPLYEELSFLLDHPRRCFTLLFPKQATWWLFAILILLNAIDIIFFIILDLNDPTITVLPPGIRFIDGVFQAFSTRTAGFAVVNLAELHPAIQVSYLIMMYISVFPIAISVRRTNVYEEKSLGIYPQDSEDDNGPTSYVGAHLRRQLSFDLWFVFLGLFIICIVEGDHLENTNDYAFTIFSVLFEIVSAYGTVGLSLGYPNSDTSFSGQFRVISKLVIIAMQIRGRHRGLPYALDRAILLPSESLQRKEAEEAAKRAQGRRMSTISAETLPHGEDETIERSGPQPQTPQPGDGLRSRRFSASDLDGNGRRGTFHEHFDLVRQGTGLRKIVSGALSAGPTVRKPKKES